MATDRQRFWWAVDRAMRELPVGSNVTVEEGGLRAYVEQLPTSGVFRGGGPRYRLYVSHLPPPRPKDEDATTVSARARAIFGSAP